MQRLRRRTCSQASRSAEVVGLGGLLGMESSPAEASPPQNRNSSDSAHRSCDRQTQHEECCYAYKHDQAPLLRMGIKGQRRSCTGAGILQDQSSPAAWAWQADCSIFSMPRVPQHTHAAMRGASH